MIPKNIPFFFFDARGMYSRIVLFFPLMAVLLFFPLILNAQTGTDTKELDRLLRDELGVPSAEKSKINASSNDSTLKESNPVQERYLEKDSDSPSATWILVKILFVLGILMGSGYFLVLRLNKSKQSRFPLKGFMRVLSSISLSPGQNLQVVEVGNRFFVLGLAEGGVSLVSEITDPEEKSRIKKSSEDSDPYQPNFIEVALEAIAATRKKIRVDKSKLEIQAGESLTEWRKKSQETLERLKKQRKAIEDGGS